MQSLTGLTGFYWLLFFGYALAVVLLIQSRRADPDGERVGGMLASGRQGKLYVIPWQERS